MINWNDRVSNIVNLIRGLSPAPTAYSSLDGQVLKIFTAEGRHGIVDRPNGSIGPVEPAGLPVAAADGYVILQDVQLAGKKRMPVYDFLRGYRLKEGSRLGG